MFLASATTCFSIENNSDLKFYANDFEIIFENTGYKSDKTAGFYPKKSGMEIFEQSDIYKIWNEYKLINLFPESEPAVHENGGFYGGLRKTFYFKSDLFALIPIKSKNCFFVSLINLSKKNIILKAPCLPENINDVGGGSFENYDFNAIGGGNAEYNDGLLLALGAPSVYQPKISNLSQQIDSPYGKILYFSSAALSASPDNLCSRFLSNLRNFFKIKNYTIFSIGHRNIQSILNYKTHIYAAEHGPKGGDELNLIKKGKNYGWPLFSLGSTYQGVPYKALGNITFYEPPLFSFVPSLGLSYLTECPISLRNRYEPLTCILAGSLVGSALLIVLIEPIQQRVLSVEKVFIGMRLREFSKGDNGNIYVSTDGSGIYEIHIKPR